jgi:hypothetical protein
MDEAPPRHLDTAVVWHQTRQRRWRPVVLRTRTDPVTPRFIVLGSTDTELPGRKLIELYAVRFPSACLCRDRQPFTGRLECQARAESALEVHGNASLATLHLVRAEDLGMPPGQESPVCSRASWKPRQCNARWLDVLMEP